MMKLTEIETMTHKDGVVTIVNTKQMALTKYEFWCECGTVHQMNAYAMAQLAMQNALVFMCPICYNRIDLKPFKD